MEVNEYLDNFAKYSDEFAKQGLKAYKLYEKTLGTNVTVTRLKSESPTDVALEDDQRYYKLLKSAMNISENTVKDHTITFQARLVINKSQFSLMYQKTVDEIQVLYTNNKFIPGDIVSFRYMGHNYKFKVTPNIESFGLEDDIVYKMTLQPYRETK